MHTTSHSPFPMPLPFLQVSNEAYSSKTHKRTPARTQASTQTHTYKHICTHACTHARTHARKHTTSHSPSPMPLPFLQVSDEAYSSTTHTELVAPSRVCASVFHKGRGGSRAIDPAWSTPRGTAKMAMPAVCCTPACMCVYVCV